MTRKSAPESFFQDLFVATLGAADRLDVAFLPCDTGVRMIPNNSKTGALVALVAVALGACANVGDEAPGDRGASFMAVMTLEEGGPQARGILWVANTYEFVELRDVVGLSSRATAHLIARRDGDPTRPDDDDRFITLADLDDTPWFGAEEAALILEHVETQQLLDAPISCIEHASCNDGACVSGMCYAIELSEIELGDAATLEVGSSGGWRARASIAGTDRVLEARAEIGQEPTVWHTEYSTQDITPWIVRRPDGTLATVTRDADMVIPEDGMPAITDQLAIASAVAYGADGSLYLASTAADSGGGRGLLVTRQTDLGWVPEFKVSLNDPSGEFGTVDFVTDADGELQLWIDAGSVARRFDRQSQGRWVESVRIEMSDDGFGADVSERTVKLLSSPQPGEVLIHRATWSFGRSQELLRVTDRAVTEIIDLPDDTVAIAADDAGRMWSIDVEGRLVSDPLSDPAVTDLRSLGYDVLPRSLQPNGDSIFVTGARGVLVLRRL